MDIIKTYLDNIFATLPRTETVLRARNELQASMEEKYRALKAEGKSENEAIGSVIAEFGNIDELIAELGIGPADQTEEEPLLDQTTAAQFQTVNKRSARMIGSGVFCIILGVAAMFLIRSATATGWSEVARGVASLMPLFVLVAVGVILFVIAGFSLDKYEWLKQGFRLPAGLKSELEQQQEQYRPTFTALIVVGVGLCILSPTALFLSTILTVLKPGNGLAIMLAMVAIAVYLFIQAGMTQDGFARLLQQGEYVRSGKYARSGKNSKAEKITSAVASVIFPLATVAYLLMGFLGGLWHPGWLIYPVTGILFGAFSSIVKAVVDK